MIIAVTKIVEESVIDLESGEESSKNLGLVLMNKDTRRELVIDFPGDAEQLAYLLGTEEGEELEDDEAPAPSEESDLPFAEGDDQL